jgi:general secretion pathway protein J
VRQRASPIGAAGFALVEALASLVIVGLISLMLMQGVGVGRRVWQRIDSRTAAGEAIDGAQTALRDRIEQIYPATLYDRNPPYVDFDGAADSLVLLASPSKATRPAPLQRYSLALTAAGDLVLSSISDVAVNGAPVSDQVLVSGVRALDLAYFGAADPDQTRRWRPSWRFQPTPPELVRVRVAFDARDARRWPDLIIRPRATIDSACILSPLSGRCKGRM